jgi:hypothetical protein
VTCALRLFDADQHDLIRHVLLDNQSPHSWSVARGIAPNLAMQWLVGCLDVLAKHFATEISRDGLAA